MFLGLWALELGITRRNVVLGCQAVLASPNILTLGLSSALESVSSSIEWEVMLTVAGVMRLVGGWGSVLGKWPQGGLWRLCLEGG